MSAYMLLAQDSQQLNNAVHEMKMDTLIPCASSYSHENPSGLSGKVAPDRWMTTLAAKWPALTASERSLPATIWLRKPAVRS